MNKKISYYWLCQLGGWGLFMLINTFFYFTLSIRDNYYPHYFESMFFEAALGIMVTHTMRSVIVGARVLSLKLSRQITWFIIITISFGLIYSSLVVAIEEALGWEPLYYRPYNFTYKWLRGTLGTLMYLTIWNLLYFAYHYMSSWQQQKLNEVRLQSLVKELELKTIKAHINPHFIFNALNSIRALVDEDPPKARTAITSLSQLLRNSMAADKEEFVSLEKELTMVKNYLALEQIRFEDRLHVHFDIDEDTLKQKVPHMMLQTLVENAIKHGISKEKNGGTIEIISDFVDKHHALIVRNTGAFIGEINGEGFGLSSTRNRLNLLYNNDAGFEIKNLDNNQVEARVSLPFSN